MIYKITIHNHIIPRPELEHVPAVWRGAAEVVVEGGHGAQHRLVLLAALGAVRAALPLLLPHPLEAQVAQEVLCKSRVSTVIEGVSVSHSV